MIAADKDMFIDRRAVQHRQTEARLAMDAVGDRRSKCGIIGRKLSAVVGCGGLRNKPVSEDGAIWGMWISSDAIGRELVKGFGDCLTAIGGLLQQPIGARRRRRWPITPCNDHQNTKIFVLFGR